MLIWYVSDNYTSDKSLVKLRFSELGKKLNEFYVITELIASYRKTEFLAKGGLTHYQFVNLPRFSPAKLL